MQMSMKAQETSMMQRRIQDLQTRESALLQEKHALTSERDALQVQLSSFAADLNTQKSTTVLQSQRFDQECSQFRDQLRQLQEQLKTSQVACAQGQLDLTNERSAHEKIQIEKLQLQSQLQAEVQDKSKHIEESKEQKMFIGKLQSEKTESQTELASLKRNVNQLMLRQRVKNEGEGEASQEKIRLGERLVAELESRKKDTSVLGSQLQECFVRNEKLSKVIEERSTALLSAKDQSDRL